MSILPRLSTCVAFVFGRKVLPDRPYPPGDTLRKRKSSSLSASGKIRKSLFLETRLALHFLMREGHDKPEVYCSEPLLYWTTCDRQCASAQSATQEAAAHLVRISKRCQAGRNKIEVLSF